MDSLLFQDAPSGHLVPTIQDARAFVPAALPPRMDMAVLLKPYGEAMSGIGALNAKLAQIKNPRLVIRPLQRREALLSSAMEGTYTTSDELALLEAGAREGARADTLEVHNYVMALTSAVNLMEQLPICHRLIKETHMRLLSGLPQGRGGNKRPGEYKRDQNWIGGSTIAAARFVPPPPRETEAAMDQLEGFINRPERDDIPALIEAALIHYQFETIHPFADGNGRVGRILVPLLLLSRKLIASPAFYPSASLEQKKNEYIDRMFAVSARSEWTQWIIFFLGICTETSSSTIAVIDRLLDLQSDYTERALKSYRSSNVIVLINHLFSVPVVTTTAVMELLGVTRRAARMTIGSLEKLGILEKMDGPANPEFFLAREILRAEA